MARRIAITGMGAVTPLGLNVSSTWEGMVAGRSGIGPITHFDSTGMRARIAGQLPDFDPQQYMDKKDARRSDRFVQMAIVAMANQKRFIPPPCLFSGNTNSRTSREPSPNRQLTARGRE